MKESEIKISGNNLHIGNIIKYFKSPISQAQRTTYGILVCVWGNEEVGNRNIFLLSESGEVIWQIEDIGIKKKCRSYDGFVFAEDGSVEVINTGYRAKLDMKTGKIHVFEFHFMN